MLNILSNNGIKTKTNISKPQFINFLNENNLVEHLENQNKQTNVKKQKIIEFLKKRIHSTTNFSKTELSNLVQSHNLTEEFKNLEKSKDRRNHVKT